MSARNRSTKENLRLEAIKVAAHYNGLHWRKTGGADPPDRIKTILDHAAQILKFIEGQREDQDV